MVLAQATTAIPHFCLSSKGLGAIFNSHYSSWRKGRAEACECRLVVDLTFFSDCEETVFSYKTTLEKYEFV